MAIECTGEGTVTISLAAEPAALAAAASDPDLGAAAVGADDLGELLASVLGFETGDPYPSASTTDTLGGGDEVAYFVTYCGRWGEDIVTVLDVLARTGVTADLTFTDGQTPWKVVAQAGSARAIDPVLFYPGDPDPDALCVALTRRHARALLAIITGDDPEEQGAIVAKLTAALT